MCSVSGVDQKAGLVKYSDVCIVQTCMSSMYSVSGLTRRLDSCSTVMSALYKPLCVLCTVLAG